MILFVDFSTRKERNHEVIKSIIKIKWEENAQE